MFRVSNVLFILLWYIHEPSFLIAVSQNCSKTTAQCDDIIRVRWWEIEPYIHNTTSYMTGFFPEILSTLVKQCCSNCTRIIYDTQVKSEAGLMKDFANSSFVNFPVYGSMMDTSKVRKPYIPLIESPGIVYLVNNEMVVTSTYTVVINAVTKAWPILAFIYLAAMLSGIVVWALDCYRNWEHFPVSFLKGSWEGFWWSIVSMTTVGYGDRCPKSHAARVFSIIWVMIGLVLIALFNGSVTSDLTAFSMTSGPILQGEKVAVLSGTLEEQYSTTVMVKKKSVANMEEMRSHLETKSHNLMLDTYVAAAHRLYLNDTKTVYLRDVIDHTFAYGMMLSGGYENSRLKTCLERQLSLQPSMVTDIMAKVMKEQGFSTIDFSDTPIEQLKGDNLLSPFGPVQEQFYIVCSVLIFLVLVGGTIWQVRKGMDEKQEPPKLDIDGIETMEELMNRQNKELASTMREEVEKFYTSWTREKDKLNATEKQWLIPEKRHKRKAKDAIMVATIDEPRYDFTSENTFELMTVGSDIDGIDQPSSFTNLNR